MADDSSEEDEGANAGAAEEGAWEVPEYPFDSEKHDITVDFRSVAELPFDPEVSGVKTMRAIVFGKGKATHVPSRPGQLCVIGEWRSQTALCKVHFKEATQRKPEFLLGFVDYGFANSTMSGISVESLLTPLLIRKGIFQDEPRLTRVEDVAGFSSINPNSTPWSTSLKPALAKQPLFKAFKISTPADINIWMSSQNMTARIKLLATRTRAAMDAEVAGQARQDPSQANKVKAVFEAKFTALLSAIESLPATAYDVRLTSRIHVLQETTSEDAPAFLTSPLHARMRDGSAELLRTRLHQRPAPPPRATAPPTANGEERSAEPAEPARERAPNLFGELDLSEDGEDNNSEAEREEPVEEPEGVAGSKRNRRPTTRFDPPGPAGSKAKQGEKEASTSQKATSKKTNPTNPRTGASYKRGPYNAGTKATGAAALAKAAAKQKGEEESQTRKSTELDALRAKVRELNDAVKLLTSEKSNLQLELEREKLIRELHVERARAEGAAEGLEKAGAEFKAGLMAGAKVASGRGFHFGDETPRGVHSSSRGSTHSSSHEQRY